MKNKRTKTVGGGSSRDGTNKNTGEANKTEEEEEENDEVDVECEDEKEEQEEVMVGSSPPLIKTEGGVDLTSSGLYRSVGSMELLNRFSSYHQHHHLPFQHKLFATSHSRDSDKSDF
jgi:hypothetical protein